jgi:preprotein translocase subunit SecD
VKDPDRALELVGQTAELRFRPVLAVVPEEQIQALLQAPSTTVAPGASTTTAVPGASTTTVPGGAPSTTAAITPTSAAGEVGMGIGVGEVAGVLAQTPTTAPLTTAPPTTAVPPTSAGSPTTAAPTATTVPGAPTTTGPPTTAPPIDPSALLAQYELTPPELDDPTQQVVLPEYDDDGNVVVRYVLGPSALTGEALEGASAGLQGAEWVVRPTFRSGAQGIDLFNAAAAQCNPPSGTCPALAPASEGGQLAIVLDGQVVSAPVIKAGNFARDQIVISGSFDEREARDVALVLNYGALPVELEPQQSQVVSATLGDDALFAGIVAGIVGITLAALYMILYYRLLGVIAVLSLFVSGGLLWGLIAWLGESRGLALTLAGITGIIVSIGVSLDSNVVYYEHVKEDVRHGRTVRSAIDRAFTAAFSTIVKADVASLIGATLLYLLTIGSVRGFALYLGLATVLDLVASWFFMRPAVRLLARSERLTGRPALLGLVLPEEAS